MTNMILADVNVGTKWTAKPYKHTLSFYDKHGWATHTVCVNCDSNPEGENDPCTATIDQTWAGIIAACGFCSKSEALRRGFNGEAPVGYSERRVAANMVLHVWRNWRAHEDGGVECFK